VCSSDLIDLQKMQRIEKLIGYSVYSAPLPSFIAASHDNVPTRHPSSRKPEKGKFKRRDNKKGNRRQASGRSELHGGS
jgi:hypothetical protein